MMVDRQEQDQGKEEDPPYNMPHAQDHSQVTYFPQAFDPYYGAMKSREEFGFDQFDQFCHENYHDITDAPDKGDSIHNKTAGIAGIENTTKEAWQITAEATREPVDRAYKIERHTEASGSSMGYPEHSSDVPYSYSASHPFKSCSLSPSLPPALYHADEAAQRDPRGSSVYETFKRQFPDSRTASLYRKEHMRFGRQPYKPPESDPSIQDIESRRTHHVERIYNAMTSAEKAKDNDQSPAMKRWVHAPYYNSELIESIAHKVIDCLIQQALYGYRGWKHTDYVADDRKGEDEDRVVDCAGRLENIIRALEEEKTICEDVMQSASQIRMFVNAPKAYASRKHQNRLGNRKRGQGVAREVTDDNPRPGKASKLASRPRRSHTNPSATNVSQPTNTPDPLQQSKARHFMPSSRASHSPARHTLPFPRNTPIVSGGMYSSSPGITQQLSAMASRSYSVGSRSTPISPENAFPLQEFDTYPLQTPMSNMNTYPDTPDQPFLFVGHGWNPGDAVYSGSNPNLFAEHPDAALLDSRSSSVGDCHAKSDIQLLWDAQPGVPPFPPYYHGNNDPQ